MCPTQHQGSGQLSLQDLSLPQQQGFSQVAQQHQAHGMQVPKGTPVGLASANSLAGGAAGTQKLAAGPCEMLISWLSSLKMNWATNGQWWRHQRSCLLWVALSNFNAPKLMPGTCPCSD